MPRFTIGWQVRFWDAEGVVRTETGQQTVDEEDVHRACYVVGVPLRARFRPPFELSYQYDGGTSGRSLYLADYPADLPDAEALRARVRAGDAPTAIARDLAADGAGPLSVMIAFDYAFDLSLDDHAAVAAAGRLDVRVRETQREWDRPYRLRDARARGQSVVDVLHADYEGSGSIRLFNSLRVAFDLEFNDAKELIERACHRDPAFDELLTAAIARARARRS